jgi:voltage-dependent calcium channel L type alpha-1F
MTAEKDSAHEDELIFFDIINFNNYFNALLTVFQAITLEGWVLMMYNYMDANSPPWIAVLFFVILTIGGAFFALNLVLAQIMETFY